MKYRNDVLVLNGVIFRSAIDFLPANVAVAVADTVCRCGYTDMDDAMTTQIRDKIIQLGEDAEAALSREFLAMDVLPSKGEGGRLKHVQRMPFIDATLPKSQYHYFRGCFKHLSIHLRAKIGRRLWLSTPKQSFTSSQPITQRGTISGVDLSKYSRPAHDLCWPFFLVAF